MTSVNPYLKRREAVVLARETTRGVMSTAPKYAFRWLSKGIATVPGIIENESAMGNDHRVNDSAIATNHAEGPLGGKVTEDGIAHLERAIMTKVTTTDNTDGTYTHDFEYDSTVESASYSIWDVRPSTTRLYKGCVFDNLELNIEAGENGGWLEATTAVKGWKHEDVTAVVPVFVEEKEYTNRHVKLYLADDVAGLDDLTASRVKPRSVKLIRESTKTVDHSVGDGDQPEFDRGVFEAKGEMVVKYRKTDFEEGYFANKIHAMKLVCENDGAIVTYTATKVRFRELTDSDDKDAVVTQSISFYCESDADNGGHAIKSSVTNTLATL